MSTSELVLWYSGLFLQVLVCALTFWRRRRLGLPVFTIYLSVLVAREAFMAGVYHSAGYTSRLAFFSFWITQTLLLAARGAAIGELAWNAARAYPGFRVVLKLVLGGIILTLLLIAAFEAIANSSQLPVFVLGLERNFELTAAVVLVVLLGLSARYQVSLPTTQRLITFGLLAYSLIQVLNNSISRQWLESYFRFWAIVRAASFHAALVIWLVAVWKALPAQAQPTSPPDADSAALMRRGTGLIDDLAERLKRFRKKTTNRAGQRNDKGQPEQRKTGSAG
jgi:hypothetical protein